jgi:pilus assembly protein CpaD
MKHRTLFSAAAAFTGCALSLALFAAPATAAPKAERGLEPVHQPQVERSDFIFDVGANGTGALDAADERRLKSWFDALGLRFGDHVTLVRGNELPGVRDSIAALVARYGLLTEGEAPITAGEAAAGSLRVVVSRSMATVESCPNWTRRSQADLVGGQGSNYGCAMATNLAAMIADPQDLVRGRSTNTDLRAATSTRAIRAYQEQPPTGTGGLQNISTGGQ